MILSVLMLRIIGCEWPKYSSTIPKYIVDEILNNNSEDIKLNLFILKSKILCSNNQQDLLIQWLRYKRFFVSIVNSEVFSNKI